MIQSKKISIFVIEDEQTLVRSLKDKFERTGYEVKTEIDGIKGYSRIVKEKPNIVILDIILPGLNGLDILKKLKDNAETKNIPVILLSNVDDEKSMNQGKKLGAVAYFIKTNVTLNRLIEEIKRHLN